jgi:hypothetical protein
MMESPGGTGAVFEKSLLYLRKVFVKWASPVLLTAKIC